MSELARICPAPGCRVLNPELAPPTPLPDEGVVLPLTGYWLRRLKDGEIVLQHALPGRSRRRQASRQNHNRGQAQNTD